MPFPDLPDRLREVRDRIDAAVRRSGHGQAVQIVAVTKTHGPDAVRLHGTRAWATLERTGCRRRFQRWTPSLLPVRWHLIGHLQRNKVKALPRFDLLHSLDSARLADAAHEIGVREWPPDRGARSGQRRRRRLQGRIRAGRVVARGGSSSRVERYSCTRRDDDGAIRRRRTNASHRVLRCARTPATCSAPPATMQRSSRWECRTTTRSRSRRAPRSFASERFSLERDPHD